MEYYRHYNGLYLFNGFYLRVHGTQYLVINDIRSHGHVTDIIYTAEVFSSKTLDHSSCRGQRYSQYRNSHNMSFLLILTSVCAIIWFFSCVSSTVCLCIIKEASTQVLLTRYLWLSQRLRWREFFSAFVLFPDEIFGSPLRSISPPLCFDGFTLCQKNIKPVLASDRPVVWTLGKSKNILWQGGWEETDEVNGVGQNCSKLIWS